MLKIYVCHSNPFGYVYVLLILAHLWNQVPFPSEFWNSFICPIFKFFIRCNYCKDLLPVYAYLSILLWCFLKFDKIKIMLWIVHLMLHLRNLCQIQSHRHFLLSSFEEFYSLFFTFGYVIHFESIFTLDATYELKFILVAKLSHSFTELASDGYWNHLSI